MAMPRVISWSDAMGAMKLRMLEVCYWSNVIASGKS